MAGSRRTIFRCFDIPVNVPAKHVHRRVPAQDYRIVERLEVICFTQIRLCPCALSRDLAVADLVPAGLARPAAIAVNFAFSLLELPTLSLDEETGRASWRERVGTRG